jgi:BirA family transcriptional regulator, biotin operon repressor / biotin---[acetyl-CoA-carboxylase] ligase
VNQIGNPFVQLDEVESSNNYATGQVQARLAEHGATWFAHHQTAGKGQRGKSWQMEAGANIILSTVLEPKQVTRSQLFFISAIAALAAYNLFSRYALDETKIKWPNDIYWRDRKAGGILIENFFKGNDLQFSIIGIGININQGTFPSNLDNAVSLKQITGKSFDCIALAKELCNYLEYWWQQLDIENFDEILRQYNEALYKLNQKVQFKKDSAILEATVRGVNATGKLIVDTGQEAEITHGDWHWLIR